MASTVLLGSPFIPEIQAVSGPDLMKDLLLRQPSPEVSTSLSPVKVSLYLLAI